MADMTASLTWQGEGLQFRGGGTGGPQIVVDGDGAAGPSPMLSLMLGLGGCMAVDVLDIAQKMRLPVSGLDVAVEGERYPEPPRRFTKLRLIYRVAGVAASDEGKVWRAIELSREKYCSVLHSLRQDLELEIQLELS